jgi:protein-tyrosine phosphatase
VNDVSDLSARRAAEGFHVLFVCVGNVCRSPFGERLLQARLPARGFEVASAGVTGLAGARMAPETVVELEARGGSARGFRARRLTDQMLHDADLVLAATREIRSRVLAETPAALRRTFTVREFAALLDLVDGDDLRELVANAAAARSRARLDDYDVPDPWQRGPELHALAASLMAESVERIAKGLDR